MTRQDWNQSDDGPAEETVDRPGEISQPETGHHVSNAKLPEMGQGKAEPWVSSGLAVGQTILQGRYRVVKFLDRGGMGEVWQVKHVQLDRLDVIKLMKSEIEINPAVRGRFKREAKVMATLDHPNIVRVFDTDVTSVSAYIVMEFIQGRSLKNLLQPGVPMSLEWTMQILEQLCDALQEAHDKGIVHRDVKPSNLMILDGRPPGKNLKVLDFGIAKILRVDHLDAGASGLPGDSHMMASPSGESQFADALHTRIGLFLGSPQYASPEQAIGAPLDARSDIYSVGVMLYEFLTGHRPFSCEVKALPYNHCHIPPPPFQDRNPDAQVPPEIEQVVLRCLAKAPSDRYQSARELAETLARAIPSRITDWTEVIGRNPNSVAFRERGNAHADAGQLTRAIADYNQSIRLDPKDALTYRERGEAYARRGDHNQALADFDEAIRLDRKDDVAYRERGNTYAKLGDFQQAIEDYSQAIRLNRQDPAAYRGRGEAYVSSSKLTLAIVDYGQLIRLDPTNSLSYISRGEVYAKTGVRTRAIADYTEAIRLQPGDARAHCGRGAAHSAREDYARAVADYTEAIRLQPGDPLAFGGRGQARYAREDYAGAVADYTEAIRLRPGEAAYHGNRGKVHRLNGDHAQAVADHTEAMRLDPKSP